MSIFNTSRINTPQIITPRIIFNTPRTQFNSTRHLKFAVAGCLILLYSVVNNPVWAHKIKFSNEDTQNLCAAIKSGTVKEIPLFMDTLINKAGISKEQWNSNYVFKLSCAEVTPLFYSLQFPAKSFKALADYGIDLNHPIIDDQGNVSTIKDYVRFKAKTLIKYKNIYEIIKKKKAKGCNDLPKIKCTASYPYAAKMAE